jgi:hypothetical protein
MTDSETSVERALECGTVSLRRPPGGRWEVAHWERERSAVPPKSKESPWLRLDGNRFSGQTFGTPEEGAEAVRRVLAAWWGLPKAFGR